MNTSLYEQLSHGGAATVGAAADTPPTVRIVPIAEGEITEGQSGERAVFGQDALRQAAESGALDGATIVKGEGGENPHFPMDEQVPPEHVLGRVDSWTYEAGVGPVGTAQLADGEMARRIDLDLLDVSADLLRRLGDYDETADARRVDEIVAMPRITVLEQGAAPGASIETADAEALAASDAGQFLLADSAADGDADQHSPSDEGAESSADDRDTDTTDNSTHMSDEDDVTKAELREQLAAAKAELEQTEQELEQTEENLKAEREEAEALEEDLEETEAELEKTEAELEEKDEQVDGFNQALAHRLAGDDDRFDPDELAERYSTQELADKVVQSEDLADDEERTADDFDPVAAVQDHLAASPAHRGTPTGEPGDGGGGSAGGQPTEEQLAAANDWAYEALTGDDIVQASGEEQLSPRELAAEKTGVDPATCDSRQEFLRKLNSDAASGTGGEA